MNWTIPIVLAMAAIFLTLRRLGGALAAPETIAGLLPQNPVVIDVRTAAEYQAGHLPDAINLPLPELARGIGRHVPDKSRPVLLHCASGARSAAGRKLLARQGYASVHNLGSFSRARSLLAS